MANQTKATVEEPSTRAERPMDINTKLAFERTNLAHERTLMAWVRTATALISHVTELMKQHIEMRRSLAAWVAGLISVLGLLAMVAVIFRL